MESSLDKLIEQFRQFPGIGPRQARRFVYFLLSQPAAVRAALSKEITELGRDIEVCSSCFRFFSTGSFRSNSSNGSNAGGKKICSICADPSRDHSQLLIVSRDADFETIEKSHTYKGLYFILGGSIPILEKDPESRIRSRELIATIAERSKSDIMADDDSKTLKEVILALNLTPEGEHTQEFIVSLLAPYTASQAIKISTLGRGLSTGLELEYSDSETIKSALKNRA